MKCPVCGTENKSTNRACFKCKHMLDDGGVQPKGNVNSLWYSSSSSQRNRQPQPPFWGDTEGRPTYEDKDNFIVLHDEASDTNAAQDLVDRGAPVPDNRTKLGWMRGQREVQVVVPARARPREQYVPPRRVRIRWPRLILSTLAILVLFVGVGFGVFQLYQLISGSVADMASKPGTVSGQEPLVEKVMINGESWHRITFYGRDGDMVLVTDPKRSLPIKSGKAELLLEDQSFIPDDLAEDKVTVSLEATVISPDKPERKITIQPYTIDVPLAPLKIVLPKEQSVATNEDRMIVKIKVAPGSTRVMIGNENVTDHVNTEGYVSTSVKVEPSGINTILISVEAGHYRKNNYELKISRPVMDVPIELDDNTSVETSGSTVLISGSTTAGAEISTDAPLSGKISIDANGIFHFTAKLKRWGWNAIAITATDGTGKTATMVHRVNHNPALDSYSKSAQVLDYAYLMTASDAMVGRVFKIQGMIAKKYESEDSEYYLFNVGGPGESKPLVVEYLKEDGLKPDQYYSIFADVNGNYEGYPVLTARFVYPEAMPEGYTVAPDGSAAPEASPTADIDEVN